MIETVSLGLAIYCIAALALAGFVHGVFGIGFAMIATPLLALAIDYSSAILIAAVPLWVIAVLFLLIERKRVLREPMCARLMPGIIVGSVIGVMLQTALPQRVSLALLGLLLLFSALIPSLLEWMKRTPRTLRTRSVFAFGACAGVTEAALNVGAPFMVLLGGLAKLNRLQQIIVLNLCFAVGKTVQLTPHAVASPPPVEVQFMIATAVAVSGISYAGGIFFAERFSETTFRRGLVGFQCLMAALLFVRAGFSA